MNEVNPQILAEKPLEETEIPEPDPETILEKEIKRIKIFCAVSFIASVVAIVLVLLLLFFIFSIPHAPIEGMSNSIGAIYP